MRNFLTLKTFNTRWSSLPVSYRGSIVIAIPALCLAGTLGAWVWSRQIGLETRSKIDRSREVIFQSDRLLDSLINSETGVRGYELTRQKSFLEPYTRNSRDIPAVIAELKSLVEEDAEQSRKVETIEREVKKEVEILQRKIENIERPNSPDTSVILLREAKEVMDRIRSEMDRLQDREQQILEEQERYLRSVREITTSIQWLTAWVSAISYLGAVYLFNQLNRELQEREKQLVKSTSLIAAITDNVVDGVMTIDRSGKIETFNRAAGKLFGYCLEEAIGQNLSRFVGELPFLKDDGVITNSSWRTDGYHKSGNKFKVEISIGEIYRQELSIVIIRDITESELAKENLQERADELARLSTTLAAVNFALEKQNQELDKFAYVVSHDLKAPLRAIASLSEWIEEDTAEHLTGETKEQMHLLRGRVHRLEGLINGLLDYSRLGRMPADLQIVDVARSISEIIDLLDPEGRFRVSIDSPLPIFKTKKLLLEQVFTHLMGNAIKHHHRETGKIVIGTIEREKFYQFSVADDGPGIDGAFHDKIFAIFQTLLPRDTKESTGIGLSLAKKIVELEGGKIWVDSREGEGATFFFTWPKIPIETDNNKNK